MLQLIRRGDVYYAELDPVVGSEQGGTRPVVVVQNDIGNRHSPTVIVAAVTSRRKGNFPLHVWLPLAEAGLDCESVAMLETLRAIDRLRLRERRGHVGTETLARLDRALAVSVGLTHLAEGGVARG